MIEFLRQFDPVGRFDHVTRLPNRRQLLEKLAAYSYGTARADRRLSLALVTLADAQHFNQILRALGHDFSEDFIRAGARRVAAVLPADTELFNVSVLSFAFVVQAEDEPSPHVLAETVAAQFDTPIEIAGIPVRSQAGVGLVDFDPTTSDPTETMRAALTAAQDSRNHRAPYAHYDARTDTAHRRAFKILTDLPDALGADDQLELYYQPRIDLQSGACVAVEALLRWQHPTLGWVSPGEFMPLVESTDLIRPLTGRVLKTAIRQLAAWAGSRSTLGVSVNISPRNIGEADLIGSLERLLYTHGVPPDRLELEFTEGAVAADDATTLDALQKFRDLGVAVAIDDFGSGYSNMAYLTKIPADIVKIDKGFIQHMNPSGQSGFLTHKIADLAHGLGFRVVGEGVETVEAYEFLAELGCAQAQGFYMSRPLPVDALTGWLDRRPV
jgi:EAL domain-containing protein (putative c-di-GMP-specific phosphodiesterase class I)/GGDEF domain-containing protein